MKKIFIAGDVSINSIIYLVLFGTVILFSIAVYGQPTGEKKSIPAVKVAIPPKIDGKLDDTVWLNKPIANGFTQTLPYNDGRLSTQKTEVKIIYDDQAIYVGAMLYDTAPDSLFQGLGKRDAQDNDINADLFVIELNPYNDNRLLYAFKLSASGVQIDEKVTYGNWDKSWNAIWYSHTSIVDSGWVAELKIPYSALRLPTTKEQLWGMHLWRCIKRNEEWSSWNFVNEKEESTLHQTGLLTHLIDIHPPLRLGITPYLSNYWTKNPITHKMNYTLKGGVDLKYGINKSYTLDMMLIPDFGQVPADDQILNLSYTETYYDEKRSFFTEGTELFNKADIFYSRRIGATPQKHDDVAHQLTPSEKILTNPLETPLINATKLSGRNSKGTAIGFLNTLTDNTYAIIQDTNTLTERKIKTQPLTNYTVLVMDQTLPYNSSISFINTNKTLLQEHYSANVSGVDFQLSNPHNTYTLFGKGAISQHYTNHTKVGYYYSLALHKTQGNFRFSLSNKILNHRYNPYDMGYIANNNEIQNKIRIEYNVLAPFWKILHWYNYVEGYNTRLYKPNTFGLVEISSESHITFTNHNQMGLYLGSTPTKKYNFFEPRVFGWKYQEPTASYLGADIQTDNKKHFSGYIMWFYWKATEYNKSSLFLTIKPSIRWNNKLSIHFLIDAEKNTNATGFVDKTAFNDTIYFGRRNVLNLSNTIESNYIFTNKSSLSLRIRHYMSTIDYQQFYILQKNGTLVPDASGFFANNRSYSILTLEMSYSWQFTSASELTLQWRNNSNAWHPQAYKTYLTHLQHTFDAQQWQTFSFKIIYYLDYYYLRALKKRHY